MTGKPDINDVDLHAYLDGALDDGDAAAVKAALQADPALAARLAGFRADKAMLKNLYGPLAQRPLPSHWLALAQGARPARAWLRAGILAAMLMVAATASIGYRIWQTPVPSGEIVQAAIAARQDMSGQTIPVVDSARPADYNAMISAAVAMNVKAPDLGKLGYYLIELRLYDHAPGGSAAELLYRDSANRLFTLYLRRSNGDARFDQFERAGLRVCIWQDDQLGMVMTGNVSTASMQRLASLAYTGLTS